jgi:hypothetical protein
MKKYYSCNNTLKNTDIKYVVENVKGWYEPLVESTIYW